MMPRCLRTICSTRRFVFALISETVPAETEAMNFISKILATGSEHLSDRASSSFEHPDVKFTHCRCWGPCPRVNALEEEEAWGKAHRRAAPVCG